MLDIFTSSNNSNDENQFALVALGNNSYPVSNALNEIVTNIDLQSNENTYWMTDGEWSMIDMLLSLLGKLGPCEIIMSTYAFSEKPARVIADLRNSNIITKLQCIIDSRVDVRAASALKLIENCAERCVLCDTHAKVTLLKSDEHFITVIGSANYTSNKRYEAGVISTDKNIFSFYYGWINLAMDRRNTD